MKSQDKLEIKAKRMPEYGDKYWVKIRHLKLSTGWIPSFEDIFRIVQALCWCEDQKYPNGKGRFMVAEFLLDCCNKDCSWEEIRERYKVPNRDEDVV